MDLASAECQIVQSARDSDPAGEQSSQQSFGEFDTIFQFGAGLDLPRRIGGRDFSADRVDRFAQVSLRGLQGLEGVLRRVPSGYGGNMPH